MVLVVRVSHSGRAVTENDHHRRHLPAGHL